MTDVNVAIIAHVDHGKTTLVDCLLHSGGGGDDSQGRSGEDRAMDSLSLERERGITIQSKVTSIPFEGSRVNIVDTPGHADFGGEVERVLCMVDGVCLIVDATDGPNTQTRFVTAKALAQGLPVVLVINKVDRDTARVGEVENEVFDLFIDLGADDEQLDFPIIYASARDGLSSDDPDTILEAIAAGRTDEVRTMRPILSSVVEHISENSPHKKGNKSSSGDDIDDDDDDDRFRMLAVMMDRDPYLGRVLTGRVDRGTVKLNDELVAVSQDGAVTDRGKVTRILRATGMETEELGEASRGQIIQLTGLDDASVTDTLGAPDPDAVRGGGAAAGGGNDSSGAAPIVRPLLTTPIDPATVRMMFSVNTSPMVGQDGGKLLTASYLSERLERETESNVSIGIEKGTGEAYEVMGRGELQLAVLVENMRREGFELTLGPPRVLFRRDAETGDVTEPYEVVQIDVQDDHMGMVMETLNQRKGELQNMTPSEGGGRTSLTFRLPSRALLGYRRVFTAATRGDGVLNAVFDGYGPNAGPIGQLRTKGVLIATEAGKATNYALNMLEPRGTLFVGPGAQVYQGMIVGEHSREQDLDVNAVRGKQLTNMRASGADESIILQPPRQYTLEEAMGYIASDELLEVTPTSMRLRKEFLDPTARKQAKKRKEFE